MSLVGNVPLLNKLYCPREVFPIAAMIDAAVDAVIASLILFALFPIEGYAPKPETLFLPLLLIPLVAVTLGVSMAVSAIVVFMRDLRLILPLIVQMGLFATPVAYPIRTLIKSHTLQIIYTAFNPMVAVIEGMRSTILEGHPPDWAIYGVGTASSFVMLTVGFVLFKRLETGIADVA
jgi:ABC-type polysaccharide/polyol phosphate export permease